MSRDDDGEYNEHDEEEQEAQEIGAAPVLLHATPDGSLQLTVPARRPVVRARHEVLDLVDVLLLRADEAVRPKRSRGARRTYANVGSR